MEIVETIKSRNEGEARDYETVFRLWGRMLRGFYELI